MRVLNPRTIKPFCGIIFAVILLLGLPLYAQDNLAPPPSSDPNSAAPNSGDPNSGAPNSAAPNPGYRGHRENCWQVAGIPRSVAQQGKEIERNAHAQVQGVCSDPSLNPMQLQQQLRQIHEGERRQLEGLATRQQIQAYRACRQDRGERGLGVGGGCGHMTAPQGGDNGSSAPPPPPQEDAPRQ